MTAADLRQLVDMFWNKISAYATGTPGVSARNTTSWYQVFHSQWHWLLLFVVLASLTALLWYKSRRAMPVDDPWHTFVPDVKDAKDSPFFAYLGHNILTESCANDPSNTSVDAIGRIPEHFHLQNAVLTRVLEEPQEFHDLNARNASPPIQQYRSYTYPDTRNRQIRFDRIEQICDAAHDRRWQRRTMHICAI